MKIKMKTLMAGPNGTRYPDKVYSVSAQEGKVLIEGGYAEEVKESIKAETSSEPRAATRSRGRTATKPEADEVDPAESDEETEEA